jgi:cytochrome P450
LTNKEKSDKTMLVELVAVLSVAIVLYVISRISFYRNPNFAKNAPPVVQGNLPWLGDLQVFGPGLREYLEENRRKLGDIFTVYVRGQFWTFVFGDDNLKTFFSSPEKTISSFEFLYQMLEPMQPVTDKQMRAVNGSLNFVSLNHKVLNKTEHLFTMAQNIEQVSADIINKEWFPKNNTLTGDVFELTYRLVFLANIKNFAGEELYNESKEEIYELWKVMDYARLNVPKEMLLRKLPMKTPSQKAFIRLTELVAGVMKRRENKIGEIGDLLDAIMSHVRTRIMQGDMPSEVTEVEAVSMQLLNMFVASQITTSNTVGWLLIKVIQSNNPQLLKDLRKEAKNAPSPINLEYLTDNMPVMEAAITEAVRFSLLGIGGRLLMEPVQFGKYKVPKGNIMYHPYYGTAKHFTNSEQYDPYRYLEREEHLDKEFRFTPFGAGRHPCAGQSVARNLSKILMIQILNNCSEMKLLEEPVVAPTCLANFNRQVPEKPVIAQFKK